MKGFDSREACLFFKQIINYGNQRLPHRTCIHEAEYNRIPHLLLFPHLRRKSYKASRFHRRWSDDPQIFEASACGIDDTPLYFSISCLINMVAKRTPPSLQRDSRDSAGSNQFTSPL